MKYFSGKVKGWNRLPQWNLHFRRLFWLYPESDCWERLLVARVWLLEDLIVEGWPHRPGGQWQAIVAVLRAWTRVMVEERRCRYILRAILIGCWKGGWGRKSDQSYRPCSQEKAYSKFFIQVQWLLKLILILKWTVLALGEESQTSGNTAPLSRASDSYWAAAKLRLFFVSIAWRGSMSPKMSKAISSNSRVPEGAGDGPRGQLQKGLSQLFSLPKTMSTKEM